MYMVYRVIKNVIDKMGTECIITQYKDSKKHIITGILQPYNSSFNNGNNDNSIKATGGIVEKGDYVLYFVPPNSTVDYDNATVFINGKQFWFRGCQFYMCCNRVVYVKARLQTVNGIDG